MHGEMCRVEGQEGWLRTVQFMAEIAYLNLTARRKASVQVDGSVPSGMPLIPEWEKHEDGATQFGKLPTPPPPRPLVAGAIALAFTTLILK